MNLLELRTELGERSGRYDLVSPVDGTNTGMDFFINSGQAMLDNMHDIKRSASRTFHELAPGEWFFNFPRAKSIEEVWINNTTARVQLDRLTFNEMRECFPGPQATTATGTPVGYALSRVRAQDTTDMDNLGAFFNNVLATTTDIHGVFILPPGDESLVVEVLGQFAAAKLSLETDENFWSVEYPDIFVLAVLQRLEIFNRNKTGAREWMDSIHQALMDLDQSHISETSFGVDQLEG